MRSPRWSWCVALCMVSFTAALSLNESYGQEQDLFEKALKGLAWRSIGPAEMGGRTVDIAGIPGDPTTVYMATASGGLWKTTNQGVTWKSIFEAGGTFSLGAVAVAPSDPNVIYLGTGEHNPRNSASIGDGVYKSVDAGKTWTRLGLEATEKIARIRVHPKDAELVYVAALGHEWGANPERGVYRSRDGGTTWEKVLYVDEDTGASDLAMDPSNPRVLYAGLYDFRRLPWHFRSGGPGSGLYKTTDGGDTWLNLTEAETDNGLPSGTLGRIGLAVSASDPAVIYAVIESKDGVLWRSSDGGETWTLVSKDPVVSSRPFYYSDIRVDPTDENRIYAVSGRLSVSEDGGKTWRRLGENIHGDHQAFWIDPLDPDRLIDGNDGGWAISYDRGQTWDFINVVALGQFYQVGADMRDPYYVCGGLQDNDVWCGPSRTLTVAGVLQNDWYEIHGPGDGMYVQIDPTDHTSIYTNRHAGDIVHFDLATGEARSIHPYPVPLSGSGAGDHPYRFNWNAPLHMSPHDPQTVYFGSNVLFKTTDGGHSWKAVSPDLTTNDPEKLKVSGGPITPDNTSAEFHCTVMTIAESPLTPGVIWVGTDDGKVQVTRNGGESWMEVTGNVAGLPPESWVSRIEASRADAGTAYAAFDRHRLDDPAPYVYRTTDYGNSWTNITGNLPALNYVHVVREDPRNPDLIYVGTEIGIFASWTGGGKWSSIRINLPPVAVRDILIHSRDNDVIIGTHGRSIWILDDATPLQELGTALAGEAYLFAPRGATRFVAWKKRFRMDIGDRVFVGENPPYGALINYHLKEDLESEKEEDSDEPKLELAVLDERGATVRTIEGPGKAGLHRVAWDLRREPIAKPDDEDAFSFQMTAPLVLPGTYTVKMTAGGKELTAPVEVRLGPGLDVPDAELAAQHDALVELQEMGRRGAETVRRIDDVKSQLDELADKLEKSKEVPEEISTEIKRIAGQLEKIREELTRPDDAQGYRTHARLLDKIRSLAGDIDAATAPPTEAQSRWLHSHGKELDGALGRFRKLMDEDIPELGRRMDEAGIPRIIS